MAQPFSAFFRELQIQLGDEYGLWQDFAPYNIAEQLQNYKNVGTLYINNSSINLLDKPLDGISADCVLELQMKIEKTQNLSDVVLKPLYTIVGAFNGKKAYPTIDGEVFKYFITAELPTTDGELREGKDCYYVTYEIPFSIVISSKYEVYTGEEIKIGDVGSTPVNLGGVITVTEAYKFTPETNALFSEGKNLTVALSSTWILQVNAYNLPDDFGQQYIKNHVRNNPLDYFELTYDGVKHNVVVQATYPKERGQFARVTYDFFEANPI